MNAAKATLALLFLTTSLFAGSQVVVQHAALSTASPQATQIGLTVLKSGGNAIDAAVAVSFALAVAHPQAGNLGGGGFLVYYDAKTKGIWTLDFRETAPAASKRDMFVSRDGTISVKSRTGPLAAAIPGTIAGMSEAHDRFGKQAWKDLLAPAAQLARNGIKVDQTLTSDLALVEAQRNISQFQSTESIFYPHEHKPLALGATLVQRDLGLLLERLAIKGAEDFYDGELSERFVEAVRGAGGVMSLRDLREYKPVWRAPMSITFRNYQIYTTAPPSSGGLVIGEVLNILNGFDLTKTGADTPATIHLLAEAERRAYIDRNKYLGDPSAERVPYRELLSEERAKLWRASINATHSTATASLAEPGGVPTDSTHTTHFTIVDAEGNIASVTTTLSDNFGSGFVVPGMGFLLNNSMHDFTLAPGKTDATGARQPNANTIEGGKRPASEMTPTIVMKDGVPLLALGTRGGAAIPTTVLQVFLNVALFGRSLPDAIAAPRYHHQAWPEEIFAESGRAPAATINALAAMGHGVKEGDSIGDVHAVMIEKGKITAVADPRAGGAAGGY
ncbi:MAG: gamma-glutamyltransferase [Acidobacteria bacterium]|nr:gamma-glutamyltransferase [Acidobacteriota bacterium]